MRVAFNVVSAEGGARTMQWKLVSAFAHGSRAGFRDRVCCGEAAGQWPHKQDAPKPVAPTPAAASRLLHRRFQWPRRHDMCPHPGSRKAIAHAAARAPRETSGDRPQRSATCARRLEPTPPPPPLLSRAAAPAPVPRSGRKMSRYLHRLPAPPVEIRVPTHGDTGRGNVAGSSRSARRFRPRAISRATPFSPL